MWLRKAHMLEDESRSETPDTFVLSIDPDAELDCSVTEVDEVERPEPRFSIPEPVLRHLVRKVRQRLRRHSSNSSCKQSSR